MWFVQYKILLAKQGSVCKKKFQKFLLPTNVMVATKFLFYVINYCGVLKAKREIVNIGPLP